MYGTVARMRVKPGMADKMCELSNTWWSERAPKVKGAVSETVFRTDNDPNEYLLPIDYKWLLLVAFGETDFDGEGKRLWGREPVSRFRLFREEHGCAEDCDGCARVADRVSVGGAS